MFSKQIDLSLNTTDQHRLTIWQEYISTDVVAADRKFKDVNIQAGFSSAVPKCTSGLVRPVQHVSL